MTISVLGYTIFKFFYDGRPKATGLTLSQGDITQMCFLAFGELIRQQYYNSKKQDEFNRPDYSFVSPLLDLKQFELSEVGINGKRRADMIKYDLFRLPKNSHITNVYPIGSGCNGETIGEITQVEPGEENFYFGPQFTNFLFFVIKGRGIDTYHVPSCVKEVQIEATYNSGDVDISLDIAYEVALAVLGISGKVNSVPMKILDNPYAPQAHEVKHRLEEAQQNV